MKKLLFILFLLMCVSITWAQNVAKIGSTEYPTLQGAIDFAITQAGETVTIDILRDFTEGPVDITQNPGINIVINGHDYTLTGQIFISSNQQESASSLDYITIDGLKFKYDPAHFANVVSGEDAFIEFCKKCRIWSSLNYSTNVTIKNCEFDGDGSNKSIYGVSSINTTYHLTVDNCTATNMLGLAEMQSATHFTVTNCTATNVKRGLWISGGGNGTSTIENNNITAEEYVVKLENQTGYAHSFNFADNTMSSENGQVFILNNITNPSAIVNVTSGTYLGDMDLSGIDADAHLNITGGTYSIDVTGEPCAPGYAAFANGTNPETWTVDQAWFFYYDKNETEAIGTMDTIIVRRSASAADRTVEVAACDFTWLPTHTFDEWNTKADGTGTPVAVGTNIELNSDTTLYVIWKVGYSIFYDANGGTGTIPYQSKDPGVDLTLSDGTDGAGNYLITKTDSTLYRWNTAANEGGDNYALGGTYSADANDTLYAVWRLTLDMTMDSTDVVCYGENNGTDTVKIIGGEAPYMIVLSSIVLPQNDTVKNLMDTKHIFENLKPGKYNVELSDVLKKDFITGTFTIAQPDTLEITDLDVPTNNPCPLMGVGYFSASVTAQGGNDPGNYTYAWDDDATNTNAATTEVPAKADDRDYTYIVSVTVTDIKGCTATATANIEVSPVIVHIDSIHGNTTMKIDTIKQGIMQGCDTIIRDFGYPTFTFSNPAITEDILASVTNDIPTVYPDSIFSIGYNPIIWTAVDTCGHEVTCEQIIYIYHYPCPSVDDAEGNTYNGVRVGCLCWTDRNLVSTKYSSNGNAIPNLMSYVSESFPNATDNVNNFGYLYDWYAAADTVTNSIADIEATYAAGKHIQGACPNGWYLPTDEDFKTLESFNANDLRSTGLWLEGNGTNSTGFNAVPGGYYNCETGRYEDAAGNAYYWSCHPVYDKATGAMIDYICEKIYNSNEYSRCNGFSVRCVLIVHE